MKDLFRDRLARTHGVRAALLGISLLIMTSCASSGGLFSVGPKPHELVGVRVDSAKATPTDTIAWILGADGDDRTLHIHVSRDAKGAPSVQTDDKRYGHWYSSGDIGDTASLQLCVKRRAREGGTCTHVRLDTTTTFPTRRRLTLHGYRTLHGVNDRILLERLP